MKLKIVAAFCFLSLIVFLIASTQIKMRKKGREDFKKFNTASIKEQLDVAYNGNREGSAFTIKNGEKYVFMPFRAYRLKFFDTSYNPSFDEVAKKGDSIIKRPCSDTLFLKKDTITYSFTFIKAE
ncbi:hypothetical protein FMM05_05145 [Flavobacterium zepuense]|uniref:Uncharacterized protein n=1 Tax=Flavobacterium zepuense TaxID=2593302 RepID=A0A552V8H9_9FLAO|nr:hypothetical protein [Flavobacterium zepuense]TRW26765.1 hypothetical protein FMM05_05145 [Flavobacterium zepuense]